MIVVNNLYYKSENAVEGVRELNKLLIQGWELKTSCIGPDSTFHHFLTKNETFKSDSKNE